MVHNSICSVEGNAIKQHDVVELFKTTNLIHTVT